MYRCLPYHMCEPRGVASVSGQTLLARGCSFLQPETGEKTKLIPCLRWWRALHKNMIVAVYRIQYTGFRGSRFDECCICRLYLLTFDSITALYGCANLRRLIAHTMPYEAAYVTDHKSIDANSNRIIASTPPQWLYYDREGYSPDYSNMLVLLPEQSSYISIIVRWRACKHCLNTMSSSDVNAVLALSQRWLTIRTSPTESKIYRAPLFLNTGWHYIISRILLYLIGRFTPIFLNHIYCNTVES